MDALDQTATVGNNNSNNNRLDEQGFRPTLLRSSYRHHCLLFDRTFHHDRYLLQPREGMGITDEGTRRQILKALDALKE